MKIKGILVCTHGRLGEEFLTSAAMIVGNMQDVQVFSLMPGTAPEEYSDRIENVLKAGGAYLCLVDIAGGTPFNVLAQFTRKYPVTVVTGLNLPMLIEAYESMQDMEAEELVEYTVQVLRDSGRILGMSQKLQLRNTQP